MSVLEYDTKFQTSEIMFWNDTQTHGFLPDIKTFKMILFKFYLILETKVTYFLLFKSGKTGNTPQIIVLNNF